MLGIFVELFPLLVLKAFAWMLPAFLLAWIVVLLQKSGFLKPLGDLLLAARRMSPAGWLCVAPLVVGLVVYASTKNDGGGTNDAPTHMSAPRRMLRSLAEGWLIPSTPVTPDEIAAGYRAPASGVAGIVPAPGGAVTNARWRLRGAHDDALRLDPAGLRIPVLDGVVTGVTVLARGEVRPDVGTLYFPVSPVDGVSLLPESRRDGAASLFWHALSPSNSLLLTWENALVGRDPNCPTNLQAELYADGRFAWRTDDAARLYLPVLEFDWDGDGLENSVDPDPLVAGPDAHGTNAEWYRVVCTNAFMETSVLDEGEADTRLPPGVGFRENVNSNGVYFVDLVAEEGPAPIYVVSGQYSLLGSPVLVANPGVTNRVPLVIGVEYAVTSPVPFSVGLPMGGFAELLRDEPTRKTVKWPLDFSFTEESCRDGVRTYSVHVGPYDPGGHFSWEETEGPHGRASLMSTGPSDSSCSCVSTYGGIVTFYCSPTCNCVGDCKARVSYYSFGSAFTATGGVCRCGFEDPGEEEHPPVEYPVTGGVSVSCSDSAVIFEDAYQDSPGVWKPKKSTRMRLSVSAWGGEHGGTLVLSSENLGKLSPVACGPMQLPPSTPLRPGQDFSLSFICEAAEESASEGDIKVRGRFYENETGNVESNDVALTAIRVEVQSTIDPPDASYASQNRHRYGVCERVDLNQYPASPIISWNPSGGGSNLTQGASTRYFCPLYGCDNPVKAECGGATYTPRLSIIEPQSVQAKLLNGLSRASVVTFSAGAGQAGGIGMRLRLLVRPMSVSFTHIKIEEVPQLTYRASGYFENPYFNGAFAHTTVAGAGNWLEVKNDNSFAEDTAAYNDTIPWLTPNGRVTTDPACAWTGGYIYIDNPFGWSHENVEQGDLPYREFATDTVDEIMLEPNGMVGVRKLVNQITRTTNNVIRLNGVLIP